MRIVVTGSHGVGKTTLVWQLLKYLNGIEFPKEDMMRIGVTGSHGTGKTTLSKLIAGRLKYAFLPETPFQALQAGFPINETTSLAAELWMFARQAEQELRADNWVADKCMIDLLAYAHYFFENDKALINVLSRMTQISFQRYDVVVYLPTGEFPLEDDGFRSMDPRFQNRVDQLIRGVMDTYDIKYHPIVGTPTERFQQVSALIK